MKANAIVYTSNTGLTERYAHILAEKTGLAVYRIEEAKGKLAKGERVIYLGWLMAGMIVSYKKARKLYNIAAVCGVGLGDTGAQDENARKTNKIPSDIPVFTLQGGMDHAKLTGVYRSMIDVLTKVMTKKKNKTEDEEKMTRLLISGGDFVSEENLGAVLSWWESAKIRGEICNR